MPDEILQLPPEAKDELLKDLYSLATSEYSYLSKNSDYAKGYFDAVSFQKGKMLECFTKFLK